jgi:Protein of unknown function (DUF3325)
MNMSAWGVYLGFGLLALSKNRHSQQIWPDVELDRFAKRILNIVGWLLLIAAAIYLIYDSGIGNGLVKYTAVLSLSGLLLVFHSATGRARYWPLF